MFRLIEHLVVLGFTLPYTKKSSVENKSFENYGSHRCYKRLERVDNIIGILQQATGRLSIQAVMYERKM